MENGKKFLILDNPTTKLIIGPGFHSAFNKVNGFTATWGATKEDDPDWCPAGPLLCDIEVSTVCHGLEGAGPCRFCYKGNTVKGQNMSLETFKQVFSKLPKTVSQIAFGIGSIDANPDLFSIMEYCRNNPVNPGVVPNITINGSRMKPADYENLAQLCGAVAISHYDDETCFSAVQELNFFKQKLGNDATLRQINIHQLLSRDTYDDCMKMVDQVKNNPMLESLNAIVFLLLKPKGARNTYYPLKDFEKYKALIDKCLSAGIRFGFDSCSANSFVRAIDGHEAYHQLKMTAEPCESTCFSLYINTDAKVTACSFAEDEPDMPSIDILKAKDFLDDVWYHPEIVKFREKLLEGKRSCPIFDIEIGK